VPIAPKAERNLRQVVMGICTVATGIWIGSEALEALRTGVPIPGYGRYNSPMEGWVALPMSGFLVFLGFCVIGVGLGYIKLKRPG
jgi:hypothetical protein